MSNSLSIFQRKSTQQNALLLLAMVLVFAAYWGGLTELVGRWHRQEEYSHGFFLPLVSLWILWHRRAVLAQSVGAPSGWGIVCISLSLSMLILGEFSAIFLLIQTGFLVALCGLVLCYGGWSLLRLTILPIGVLLFAIPLPYFVDSQLSWRLQLMSSSLGVSLLRTLGYSVYLEGNVIDLGMYKLQVIEACSGLRYLYPLLSIGFLMAYMYPAALVWRAVVFLSTIPITVLTNSFRIAMVGVLVERWGAGMADGFLHYFEGWVIFLLCQLILFGEIWLIERFHARRSVLELQQELPMPAVVSPSGKTDRQHSSALLWGIVVILAAGFGLARYADTRVEVVPVRQTLKTFPLQLGEWQAQESSLSIEVEQALGFDDYVLADYNRGMGKPPVNFYVAYYVSQRKGVSPHSPQVCIPGGGWVISSLGKVEVPVAEGQPVQAVRLIISKSGQRQLVYYWFDQRGQRFANEYEMKWHLLLDALLRNRTDGALVRVVTPIDSSEDEHVADLRLTQFVQVAQPRLAPYVPH